MTHSATAGFLAAVLVCLAANQAAAQSTLAPPATMPPAASSSFSSSMPRGLGLGAAVMLNGPGGVQGAYDAGAWHLEGIFGAVDDGANDPVDIGAAVRFWFHLHSSSNADFSVGGGVGFFEDGRRGAADQTSVHFEGGAHIRAFIVPNVALAATLGLGVVSADKEGFLLSGQILGGVGVTYYFF